MRSYGRPQYRALHAEHPQAAIVSDSEDYNRADMMTCAREIRPLQLASPKGPSAKSNLQSSAHEAARAPTSLARNAGTAPMALSI